jgi:hypothetical protein
VAVPVDAVKHLQYVLVPEGTKTSVPWHGLDAVEALVVVVRVVPVVLGPDVMVPDEVPLDASLEYSVVMPVILPLTLVNEAEVDRRVQAFTRLYEVVVAVVAVISQPVFVEQVLVVLVMTVGLPVEPEETVDVMKSVLSWQSVTVVSEVQVAVDVAVEVSDEVPDEVPVELSSLVVLLSSSFSSCSSRSCSFSATSVNSSNLFLILDSISLVMSSTSGNLSFRSNKPDFVKSSPSLMIGPIVFDPFVTESSAFFTKQLTLLMILVKAEKSPLFELQSD